ncbi:MAG: prepilin-type N-terminal cleavage/methylation domain-containing protein [Verrucomicrobiota bacterium JB024]|nr:prepilin-type N-terminal cleavage/methylation domain-containing protein [Verrucomicrobiota bacterium JB024]
MRKQGLRVRRGAAGFTLLELMLVVVILASVAWMITGTATDNISQVRYEDTRNRLDVIREAIMGPTSAATMAKGIQSGYIVDNGRLPENIDALVERPAYANYQPFGVSLPYFDPTPATVSSARGERKISNAGGDEEELPNAEHQLMKGHRGVYLPVSSGGYFRDAWGTNRSVDGTDAIDCPTVPGGASNIGNDVDTENHGWCVSLYNDGFYADSYGMDGQSGVLSTDVSETRYTYETDMAMSPSIVADDWKTNIEGRMTVTIKNRTAGDLGLSAFRVCLLIFVNGDADEGGAVNESYTLNLSGKYEAPGNWWCLTSDTLPGVSVTAGSDQDVTLTFTDDPDTDTYVPMGEHLLVLLDASGPTPDLSSVSGVTDTYVTARVKFYPRGGVPDPELEIR